MRTHVTTHHKARGKVFYLGGPMSQTLERNLTTRLVVRVAGCYTCSRMLVKEARVSARFRTFILSERKRNAFDVFVQGLA